MTRASSSATCSRSTASAASASRPTPTGPTASSASTRRTSRSARACHILGATPNADPNALFPPLPTASTNAGQTDFTKIEGTCTRARSRCSRAFSAFFAAYGQYAFTPLLVSEQCSYGGRFFGRAYDPAQFLGDSCWMALGELRYDIPNTIKQLTRAQLYAYADHGETYNIDPALGTPKHQARRRSVGVGARAEWEDIYSVDLSIAKAIDGPRRDELRAFVILGAKY